eukprot:scaffold207809_cov32-Tisochrysis_lutea.AAC.3
MPCWEGRKRPSQSSRPRARASGPAVTAGTRCPSATNSSWSGCRWCSPPAGSSARKGLALSPLAGAHTLSERLRLSLRNVPILGRGSWPCGTHQRAYIHQLSCHPSNPSPGRHEFAPSLPAEAKVWGASRTCDDPRCCYTNNRVQLCRRHAACTCRLEMSAE